MLSLSIRSALAKAVTPPPPLPLLPNNENGADGEAPLMRSDVEVADTAHLTIFWEGTANTLDRPVTTSIGEFYTDCDAVAVIPV